MFPLVSIIIPVYNTQKYLEKCINSAINQTFQNIEIILIDDGSTDESLRICKMFTNKDSRIVLLTQINKGQGFARNLALKVAKGEYVFFLDSDDYLELETIEILYKKSIKDNAEIVICGWERIEDDTNKIIQCRADIKSDSFNNKVSFIFSAQMNLMVCSCLIKKDLFLNNFLFFPNIYHEDLYVMPKIFYYAKKISYEKRNLYKWLSRNNSTTNSFSMNHAIGIIGALNDWRNFLIKENIYENNKDSYLEGCFRYLNSSKSRTNKFSDESEKIKIFEYLEFFQYSLGNDFLEKEKELRKSINNTQASNYNFSININILFEHIKMLKNSKWKIILYGNGIIGNIFAKELKNQLVIIVDLNSSSYSEYSEIVHPNKIKNYEFDKIVICVLGREKQISEYIEKDLAISKNKIITIDISNPVSNFTEKNMIKNLQKDHLNYDIVFLPHKDYQLKTMALISYELERMGISSCIMDLTNYYKDEGARNESKKFININFLDLSILLEGKINFEALVCMNDWDTKVTKPLILEAKNNNKKTIGIIEGINDFFDLDTGRSRNAYQTVEYLLLTGKHDLNFFQNKKEKCFIVGIPRLNKLLAETPIFPYNPIAVINVNFSYGVLEEKRDFWLNSVIEACNIADIDYIITQHPADNGNLEKYNVSEKDMYDTIRGGSIIISRFGSIIIEALAMGKPVVYHNPHHEKVQKFQEPLGAYSCSNDIKSLSEAIKYELSLNVNYREKAIDFLNYHCYTNSKESSSVLSAKVIKELIL